MDFLNSGTLLPDTLPFSEAVRVGDTIYLSGQMGIVPGRLELVEGGIEAEARGQRPGAGRPGRGRMHRDCRRRLAVPSAAKLAVIAVNPALRGRGFPGDS